MPYRYDLFQSYSDDEVVDSVTEVLKRESWWIKGSEVEELEVAIADVTGLEHAVAVNSGSSALYATLESLDVDDGEVILPSFTYQATPNAVVAAGGKPVFADIETESFALCAEDVREKVTSDTVGIVPVHFAGDVAAEIRELREVADDHDLFLLEDAAHSLGARSSGKLVGSFGDAATFSFAFNKIITTGQGGMVVTDDDQLARSVQEFRVHGRNSDREYVTWGMNLVMSSIHAAIGVAQIERLDEFIDRRREMSDLYSGLLSDMDEITIRPIPPEREPVYFLYNILLPDRSRRRELRAYLEEHGIPTEVYFEPCHLTEYYRLEWGYESGDLPVTEEIADRILTLPFHVNLTDEDIRDISETIVDFF